MASEPSWAQHAPKRFASCTAGIRLDDCMLGPRVLKRPLVHGLARASLVVHEREGVRDRMWGGRPWRRARASGPAHFTVRSISLDLRHVACVLEHAAVQPPRVDRGEAAPAAPRQREARALAKRRSRVRRLRTPSNRHGWIRLARPVRTSPLTWPLLASSLPRPYLVPLSSSSPSFVLRRARWPRCWRRWWRARGTRRRKGTCPSRTRPRRRRR